MAASERKWLRRITRPFVWAWERFPYTPAGLVITGASAVAYIHFGKGQLDLVLLVIGSVGLGISALSLLLTLAASAVVWRKHGKTTETAEPIDVECGYPVPTGYTIPRRVWLPLVSVTWTWVSPEALVRVVPKKKFLVEEVIASRRGIVHQIVRKMDVGDVFGLTRMRFKVVEKRRARFVPSVGNLKQLEVVRGMAGGQEISHPEGPPEGDLYDLRHYNPGDPIRFVLWKVFARTRQLVVRAPERALSPVRQAVAYLVAHAEDEPAAGAARVAVDNGALGDDWVLGADGSPKDATKREEALDVLAQSADEPEVSGRDLGKFFNRRASSSTNRAVVFVPGRPGPWIEQVLGACRERGGRVEFIVCTDGIIPSRKTSWRDRIRNDEPEETLAAGTTPPCTSDEISETVRRLGAVKGKVIVIDRQAGRVFSEAHVVKGVA